MLQERSKYQCRVQYLSNHILTSKPIGNEGVKYNTQLQLVDGYGLDPYSVQGTAPQLLLTPWMKIINSKR